MTVHCPNLSGSTKLLLWLADAGDAVHEGERIAELSIPGAACELIAPCNGKLLRRLVAVGQYINAGQALALIEPEVV